LSSNYYAQESDVGYTRVDVVSKKLSSLNPYVTVKTEVISQLSEEHFKTHTVVVICDGLMLNQITNNQFARQYGTKFILANTFGLMGSIFCDFGDEFVVTDQDGELIKNGNVVQVENDKFITYEPHKMYQGEFVKVKSNELEYSGKISKIHDKNTFSIEGVVDLGMMNLTQGMFTQIKEPKAISYVSLKDSIIKPEFVTVVSNDFDRPKLLHDFHTSLNMFINTHRAFPTLEEHINEMLNMVTFGSENHKEIFTKLCKTCTGKFCPVDSVFGAIAAQEIMKAVSKKFTPIKQWLYLEFTDIIPDDNKNKEHYVQTRYESQVAIFGEEMQKKINDTNIFIVGAGAIGCELLKNLAMMGIGNIHISDMDIIEKSNLNRQFLFRNNNIGQPKAVAACEAIKQMNSSVNLVAHVLKVAPETENIFSSQFYENTSVVMTALDNLNARHYVDKKCVEYGKHLIDSGTLGPQGNVQVVVPYITESYGASNDPQEDSIAVCTLKMFPYQPAHCIQYAKSLFIGMFTNAPQNFMKYKSNPDEFNEMNPSELAEPVKDILFVAENAVCHPKECIKFAYKIWHEHFRDQLHYLIQKFPENATTSEGTPFWVGTKNFPNVLSIDTSDLNVDFIEATANLWADVFGLSHVTRAQCIAYISKASTKFFPYKKQEGEVVIDEKKDEVKEISSSDDYRSMLPDVKTLCFNVTPLEFEKDDDTNFHIDFITSTSNLRATNYKIPLTDKFRTKGIAGKIIPALITTTSLVSGLACIELMKILNGIDNIEKYTNSFVNLGISFFGFSEPNPCKKVKIGSYEFSQWSNLSFPNIRLQEIIDSITAKVNGVSIGTIYAGDFVVYDSSDDDVDKEKLLSTSIGNLYLEKLMKKTPGITDVPDVFKLDIFMNTDEMSDPISCVINC
jgi:ubiquitin-activating enzyme E1